MKHFNLFLSTIVVAVVLSLPVFGGELSRDDQERIVANYRYVMGQLDSRSPLASAVTVAPSEVPLKCATSAVLEYVVNRHQIDPAILGATETVRPSNTNVYVSPGGKFKIHYDVSGPKAIYQGATDTDHNGVPDYVDGVAQAADSVYRIEVTTMGFQPPPRDDFYAEGGDSLYDIYLDTLSSNFYGLAYPEKIVGDSITSIVATSFIKLDNDYQGIEVYKTRPLDAVRVTLAHEFFHSIQFGIDFTEFDQYPSSAPIRPWWMEMSAVWMEEHCYTDINDYYSYLPFFFNYPTLSIQDFRYFPNAGTGLHAYGGVVWPLFLSQKFGDGIMKAIWEKCGQLGFGSSVLVASELAIDSASAGAEDYAGAYNEFAVWNFFTGEYASCAPNNRGYAERAAYPVIPMDSMARHREYPFTVPDVNNTRRSQYNGATYYRFDDVSSIRHDHWRCGPKDPVACDSMRIDTVSLVEIDTLCCSYDTTFTLFIFGRTLDLPCGVSLLYQLESRPDSFVVERYMLTDESEAFWTLGNSDTLIVSHNPRDYRSITAVVTTATTAFTLYGLNKVVESAYGVTDSSGTPTDRSSASLGVLTPYPNPAISKDMGGLPLTFRYQVPIDSLGVPDVSLLQLRLDVFAISGERVRSIEGVFEGKDDRATHPHGIFTAEWDMKNDHESAVASGAYLVLARLYTGKNQGPVAQKKVKVAVIR